MSESLGPYGPVFILSTVGLVGQLPEGDSLSECGHPPPRVCETAGGVVELSEAQSDEGTREVRGRSDGSDVTGSTSPTERGGCVVQLVKTFLGSVPDSEVGEGYAAVDLVSSVKGSTSSMGARVKIACLPVAFLFSFCQVLATQLLRVASKPLGEGTMSAISFSILGAMTSLRCFCGPLCVALGHKFFLFSVVASACALFQLSTVRHSWFRGGSAFIGILGILSPLSAEKMFSFLPGIVSRVGEVASSLCPSFVPMGALLSFTAKGLLAYRLSGWMEKVSGAKNPDRGMWDSRNGCCSAFEILWKSVPLFAFSLICVPLGLCWPSLFGYSAGKEVEMGDYKNFRQISVSYPELSVKEGRDGEVAEKNVEKGEREVENVEKCENEEQRMGVCVQQGECGEAETNSNIVVDPQNPKVVVEEAIEWGQETFEEITATEFKQLTEVENPLQMCTERTMADVTMVDVREVMTVTEIRPQLMVDFASEHSELRQGDEDVGVSTDDLTDLPEDGKGEDFCPSSQSKKGCHVSLEAAKQLASAYRAEEGSETEEFPSALPRLFQGSLFSAATSGVGSPLWGRVYPWGPVSSLCNYQGSEGLVDQGALSRNDFPSQGLPLFPPPGPRPSHYVSVRAVQVAAKLSKMLIK